VGFAEWGNAKPVHRGYSKSKFIRRSPSINIYLKAYNEMSIRQGRHMRCKRKLVLGAFFILAAVLLFLSFQNFQPTIESKFRPTQTSLFSGPVDATEINKLRTPEANRQISREQAIGLAELYCAFANSLPKVEPSNIEANLMTEKEASSRLESQNIDFSNKSVWLVSMEGLWEHEPPPVGPNETSAPLQFTRCRVMIEAKSGEMINLTN
jgi:hypothetical protein